MSTLISAKEDHEDFKRFRAELMSTLYPHGESELPLRLTSTDLEKAREGTAMAIEEEIIQLSRAKVDEFSNPYDVIAASRYACTVLLRELWHLRTVVNSQVRYHRALSSISK